MATPAVAEKRSPTSIPLAPSSVARNGSTALSMYAAM
jgi:hypothetical protein